jgi:quercetin dioxygenase-like cupin family protein
MEPISLDTLTTDLFARAGDSSAGRAAHNLLAGREHPLSQTLIAIVGGHGLAEHESPGEATLHVLRGRVRFTAGPSSVELSAGDLLPIPPERHSVDALEDAVLLLSVVK